MIVVDANVLAYFFIEGDKTALARQVRERDPHWVAPELWRHEFANILVSTCLFAEMTTEVAARVWADAEIMMRECEYASDIHEVLRLAAAHSTSAYDAEYVALARGLGVRCVTEDRPLRKAFPDTTLSMQDFLELEGPSQRVKEAAGPRYRTRHGRR